MLALVMAAIDSQSTPPALLITVFMPMDLSAGGAAAGGIAGCALQARAYNNTNNSRNHHSLDNQKSPLRRIYPLPPPATVGPTDGARLFGRSRSTVVPPNPALLEIPENYGGTPIDRLKEV